MIGAPVRKSTHAKKRMSHRGVNQELVNMVLLHGRLVYTRGATIYFVGDKEIKRARKVGLDLSSCRGLHVVYDNRLREVVTVYKNNSLKTTKRSTGRNSYRK